MFKRLDYIIFTLLIIILSFFFFYSANAQIQVVVVPYEETEAGKKCAQAKRFGMRNLDWEAEELGNFSDGKKLLLSKGSIDCIGGQVSDFYMLLDETDISLEILMHEAVHMGQREGSDREVQAYGTTKYFFEAIEMLAKHDLNIVINIFLDELKKLI